MRTILAARKDGRKTELILNLEARSFIFLSIHKTELLPFAILYKELYHKMLKKAMIIIKHIKKYQKIYN